MYIHYPFHLSDNQDGRVFLQHHEHGPHPLVLASEAVAQPEAFLVPAVSSV